MPESRIRAAVFIDFDNIFSGLLDLDPGAARAFAQEPLDWLKRLAIVGAGDAARSYLVRRCYMNPAGSRTHAALGTDRVFFSRYRPYFTKAGFEVIDCPSLTLRHKNAADIRICLDIFESLSSQTRYDEYVIASGDSDFAPLLHRLRAADRRITVLAGSQTAIAYESLADLFLDEQDVIALMTGMSADTDHDAPERTLPDHAPARSPSGPTDAATLQRFREIVESALTSASVPIHLAALGLEVRSTMGDVVDESDWFGNQTLSRSINALGLPNVVVVGQHAWVDGRHKPPPTPESHSRPELPEIVERVCRVTNAPMLDTTAWQKLFEAFGEYAAGENSLTLAGCTRWVRDRLDAGGVAISRRAVSFVAQAAMYGGCALGQVPPPSAHDFAAAFLANTVNRAIAAGLELSPDELPVLTDWMYAPIEHETTIEVHRPPAVSPSTVQPDELGTSPRLV